MKNKFNILLLLCSQIILMTQLAYAQKFEMVFRNAPDSTRNFYFAVIPEKEVKAFMILLPAFGEVSPTVFDESKIPEAAIKENILVIVPTLKNWDTFYLDSASQNILSSLIIEIVSKYKLQNKPFIIGGFSLGASGAVKYAETALQPESRLPKPSMLFGIDPPLDLEKMIQSFNKTIARNSSETSVKEAKFIKEKMNALIGSSNEEFKKASAYSYADDNNSHIKTLLNIPVRLYTEPDIVWQIENRGRDFYDLNSSDCSAMINDLRILGNKNAELKVSIGKGYRKNGNRNPHSWSIVDEKELMIWIKNYLKI